MRTVLAVVAFISSGLASAEPIEIRRVTPTDGAVCKMSQEIILLKCVRATTIDCEQPGAPVSFECVRGVPFPAGAVPKPRIETRVETRERTVIVHDRPTKAAPPKKPMPVQELLRLLFH